MNFKTEICTMDNWGPDHIRILDGKFMPINRDVHCEPPEKRADSIKKRQVPCEVYTAAITMQFESVSKCAAFLGRDQAIISKAFLDKVRVRSKFDGELYSVRRLSDEKKGTFGRK